MHVIDISEYQKGIDLKKVPCDGVVIKACEGKGAQWRNPEFPNQVQNAHDANKPVAFYQFASTGNTPLEEVANFVEYTKPLDTPETSIVLDWEKTWTPDIPAWCSEWLDRVADIFQREPILYLNLWTSKQTAWGWAMRQRTKLWLAQYPTTATINGWGITDPDLAPSLHGRQALTRDDTPWDKVVMWQYTSRGRLTGWNPAASTGLKPDLDLNDGSIWEES